jgi:hypothetical protein
MQRTSWPPSAYFVRGSSVAFVAIACVAMMALSAGAARAEIFILANDGQVQGEELKVTGTPANQTVIRTASGGQLTLDKSQIKQIIPQGPAELEYERIRPTYADTVDDQWRLADWCRAHALPKQRQVHLERIIALDPNHKAARAALGFEHIEGRWILPDDLRRQQGYVKYRGEWRLPQEVELLERARKEEQAEKDWIAKLNRWRVALDKHPEKSAPLHDELMQIDDPAAVPALTKLLTNERHRSIKILMIEELLHIGTPGAMSVVVARTMDDADEEVRLTAMDRLVAANHPEVVPFYIAALKGTDNARINQAALCLGMLGDKSAISPLIDALRTTHRHVEQQGQPGQISTTFGSGPGNNRTGGMSVGGTPKETVETLENQQVLRALMAITGVSFQFDQKAWRAWYVGQMRSLNIDARRG